MENIMMPFKPGQCPFEREIGDGCYKGDIDEKGMFTGDWCCALYDSLRGCQCG